MPASHLHPEQLARQRIDAMLRDAGWVIQDYSAVDFMAAPAVAVREFMTPEGPLDYLLVADRKGVGYIEAKAEGHTLRSVENQEERYNTGFKPLVPSRWPGKRSADVASASVLTRRSMEARPHGEDSPERAAAP